MKSTKNHDRYHIFVALIAITSLIILGTVIFHNIENWSFVQSFYFSVATLMTVGYGDLHPTTDFSRLIAAFYILAGVGTTFTAITVIVTDRINSAADRMRDYAESRKNRKEGGIDEDEPFL